jgi:hypothetical protein
MKYQELQKAFIKPIFSKSDLLFAGFTVYASQLFGWRKRGLLGVLKRGVYFFTDRKEAITRERVAGILYEPSYISLEFALSHYGFIPEAVFTVTSVTTRTTRKFSNEFGTFSFRHIHPKWFFGYVSIDIPGGRYLLAEPEKALLDYFYFNLGALKDEDDIRGLRINGDELRKTIDRVKLEQYLKEFGIEKLARLIYLLFEVC